jgi:hypothetical protein
MKHFGPTDVATHAALAFYFVSLVLTIVATGLHALAYFQPVDLHLPALLRPGSAVAALILGVAIELLPLLFRIRFHPRHLLAVNDVPGLL